MPVKVSVGPPSYNKGAHPSKEPPGKIFPVHKAVAGYEVWISIPRPDKLYLIGDVLPEQFGTEPQVPSDKLGPMLMSVLASGLIGKVRDNVFDDGVYRWVLIDVDPSDEPVFFQLKKAPADSAAVHRLVLQLNPARLAQDGIFELLDRLHKFTPNKFRVGAFLSTARVTRLDVAIDVVGVGVADLLVSAAATGKEVHYLAEQLETVELHRKLKTTADGELSNKGKANPVGPILVKYYDKRRQQIAAGEQPPFGKAEVTRVEVTKTRFGNKPFLVSSLPKLSNPFAKIRVGLVRSAGPPGSWTWLRYVQARRGVGHDGAALANQLSKENVQDFGSRYVNHPADVIDGKAAWKLWQQGIEATGLNYMIEAAQQLTGGVPFPPDWIE